MILLSVLWTPFKYYSCIVTSRTGDLNDISQVGLPRMRMASSLLLMINPSKQNVQWELPRSLVLARV